MIPYFKTKETSKRYTLHPLQHEDIYKFYEKIQSSIWHEGDIPYTLDRNDWENKLNKDEKHFIKHVLAFFAACFTADTEILDVNGNKIRFDDLTKRIEEGEEIFTFAVSKEGKFEVTKITKAFISGYVNELVGVKLDNNTSVKCTPKHKFMLRNGEYKKAEDLVEGDSLMTINFNNKLVNKVDYKVVSVTKVSLEEIIPVYDLTVESEHHNFPLANGVMVHNSDGIVNENLAINMLAEVGITEAEFFYAEQIAQENVHSSVYSRLILGAGIPEDEKLTLLDALHTMPAVQKKSQWAIDWIDKGNIVDKLVAFSIVEGIMFSASFCAIYYMKNKGLLPALSLANDFIARKNIAA